MRSYGEIRAKSRQAKRMNGEGETAANKEKLIRGICRDGHCSLSMEALVRDTGKEA